MSNSYDDVMARRSDIMRRALALDYDSFQHGDVIFDYDALMSSTGYSLDDVARIQAETKVGDTPLYELHRLTEAVREIAGPGKGARILLKDEAANASGSFKARRASLSAHEAQAKGFAGMVTATSGNYGAGVASQAAQRGLACIVIQEIYDSQHVGQPEIVEKSRACEAYGAEVIKLTVGPELFYVLLRTLEDTGYFNASLYTPYGIAGIETLGAEIGREVQQRYGRQPDAVVVTHAGGGNITGTTRGLRKMGCDQTQVHRVGDAESTAFRDDFAELLNQQGAEDVFALAAAEQTVGRDFLEHRLQHLGGEDGFELHRRFADFLRRAVHRHFRFGLQRGAARHVQHHLSGRIHHHIT